MQETRRSRRLTLGGGAGSVVSACDSDTCIPGRDGPAGRGAGPGCSSRREAGMILQGPRAPDGGRAVHSRLCAGQCSVRRRPSYEIRVRGPFTKQTHVCPWQEESGKAHVEVKLTRQAASGPDSDHSGSLSSQVAMPKATNG